MRSRVRMPSRTRCARLLQGVALTVLLSCSAPNGSGSAPGFDLHECSHPGFERKLRCGTLRVLENPDDPGGRTIPLDIVVLPALDPSRRTDAVVYLVGGPGLGATDSVPFLARNLLELQEIRDIVLVDQRGTGDSNPLHCELSPAELLGAIVAGRFESSTIATCLENLDADPVFYTSVRIVDDLDAVRAALAYPRIDLVGVSYGSRLALEYLRRHPERVRTLSLRGVASPAGDLLADIGRASDRAMNRLLERCVEEPGCNSEFPDLERTFRQVLSRLENEEPDIEIPRPGGSPVRLALSRDLFAGTVRFALYSHTSARTIPALIADADRGQWDSTVALLASFLRPGLASNLSIGSYLSIVCAEDMPFFAPTSLSEPARLFLTSSIADSLVSACRAWPSRPAARAFKQPVRSSVPTLLMSGSEDPATPADSAEEIARHLGDHRHLVTPGLAHMPTWTECFAHNVARFVDSGLTSTIDESCAGNPLSN